MPIAIVVVRVMATQFQRDNKGTASAPPILTRPNGDNDAHRQVKRKINPAKANIFENRAKIALLSAVAWLKNICGLIRLAATNKANTVRGIKNTNGLTGLDLKLKSFVFTNE